MRQRIDGGCLPRLIGIALFALACGNASGAGTAAPPAAHHLPAVHCTANQTGGFHDYPGAEESYVPALFHPQSFSLEENAVFMMNLDGAERNVDLYLTMTQEIPSTEEGEPPLLESTELECRHVRGARDSDGYSCVNLPPSEMILINAQTLRFTRTAVGGWTFAGATDSENGDSIFVEYGQCEAAAP
jgi:hypothetical protein